MPSTRQLLYLKTTGEPQGFSPVDAQEALASGHYVTQPPAEASPTRASHAAARATPAGRLQTTLARRSTVQARVATLQAKAQTDAMLTDREAQELLLLESQLQHMAPVLTRLETETRQAQYRVDTQIVKEEWTDLIVEKSTAHEAVITKLTELKTAIDALAVVHRDQEDCLAALPKDLLTRLNFPTFTELLRNVTSRMPEPQGWNMVLNGLAGFVLPDPTALLDVDPGTKPLSQRLLTDYQKD